MSERGQRKSLLVIVRVLGIAQDFELIVKLWTLSLDKLDFYVHSALAFAKAIKSGGISSND